MFNFFQIIQFINLNTLPKFKFKYVTNPHLTAILETFVCLQSLKIAKKPKQIPKEWGMSIIFYLFWFNRYES